MGSLAAVRDANAAYVRELEIQRQQASGVVATRIVRVVAEASGQRAVIESVDVSGRPFQSVVKWANLASLHDQLF